MTNSRAKGARGEREWAAWLREHGCANAHRGRQHKGTPDSPDVADGIPGTHAEVKRVEALSIYKAMEQAKADAGDDVPYVAHKRNRRPWLIVIEADDVFRFADCVASMRREGAG